VSVGAKAQRAVAVGTFDGVHAGHQRVLAALLASGLPASVVTYDPHPVVGTPLIQSVRRRLELLAEAGVTDVQVVAPAAPVDVADALLVGGPGSAAGWDAADVRLVPLVEGVSSQRVRQLVRAVELAAAARMLTRPFEVEGIVVTGARRGRELGFPTANLEPAEGRLLPPRGIYAGATLGQQAAISIGVNPQFGGETLHVEAHLLDFDGDLYGELLVVELWQRLRDELVFESVDALVEEIARDVENVRRVARPV
jgi:riboflavin kinase / FMN adenylyltransferase